MAGRDEEHEQPVSTNSRLAPCPPTEWREYVSGGGSAIISVLVTFPINKTMFRQQVHAIPAKAALRQLHYEGAMHLYRGMFSPLTMKLMSSSVMFGSYSQYRRWLDDYGGMPRGSTMPKVCGAVLAGASEALFMPLERVQVLMQDQKNHCMFRNTPHAFYSLRSHGILEYYRGFSAILLRNCPGNVIFFMCREHIHDLIPQRFRHVSYTANLTDFFGGALLGALISTLFFPVNVTKTHMQLQIGGPFNRFRSVFRKLRNERGWRGMFRGVHINYTRSFISWGIINVTYENILKFLQKY